MKKRILFVIESLIAAGGEKSLVTLLSLLDYERYDVDLQLFGYGGEFEQFVPRQVKILSPLSYSSYLMKKRKGSVKMKYYCLGIKGTGMSTLAQILYDLGNEVSGYDDATGHKFTQVGLEERNIPIYYDQSKKLDKDTIVTYSVALSEDHRELQRVRKEGLRIVKYNEMVGSIIKLFDTVGVSGTHGKTTTSSLIKHILEENGGCNYFIGAGDGFATPDNKYLVVECDEFNHHFLAYHPKYSVITNIEAEHLECYKDIDDIRNAFETFANQTTDLVVANGDNNEVKKIKYKTNVIFYGFNFNNTAVIKNLKLMEDGSRFDIYIKEELYGSFEVPLFGKHMV